MVHVEVLARVLVFVVVGAAAASSPTVERGSHSECSPATVSPDTDLVTAALEFAKVQLEANTATEVKIDSKSKGRYEAYCKLGAAGLVSDREKDVSSADKKIARAEQALTKAQSERTSAQARYQSTLIQTHVCTNYCSRGCTRTEWSEPKRGASAGGGNGTKANQITATCARAKADIVTADHQISKCQKTLDAAKELRADADDDVEEARVECLINFFIESTVTQAAGNDPPTSKLDPAKSEAAWDALGAPEKAWRARDYAQRLSNAAKKRAS